MDDFLAPNATIEKVPFVFKFTEGPVWLRSGKLLFSDIDGNTLYTWDGKKVQPHRSPSHNANGNTLDDAGHLYTCEHGSRTVTRERNGKVETVASLMQGKKFSSPNDLAFQPKTGILVFTDPDYGLVGRPREISYNAVYKLDPKTHEVTELFKGEKQPNGVVFSRDGTYLYLADSQADTLTKFEFQSMRVIWRIPCKGPDGLRVDEADRVWGACGDGVRVYTPDGNLCQVLAFPEQPANLCFGEDGHTLFVTARTGVYWTKLKVKGVMPGIP